MNQMQATTGISDIERCALTIIAQTPTMHQSVSAYAQAIVNDLDEQRSLAEFIRETDAATLAGWHEGGWATDGLATAFADGEGADFYPAGLVDHHTDDARRRAHVAFIAGRDAAAAHLAMAIATHRRLGRPSGDVEVASITANLALTSSLAAAIAEHVRALTRAYDDRYYTR